MDAQNLYYILGIVSLVGGGLAAYLARRDSEQEKRFNDKLDTLKDANEKLEHMHKESDARLANVEREYISRGDHALFRNELMTALKDMSSQLNHTLDGFRLSMEKVLDRVQRVESRRTKAR
jgi:hypothetical protein